MSLKHYRVLFLILVVSLCRIQKISGNSLQSSQGNSASFYGSTHAVHTPPSTSLHVCLQFTPSQGTLLTAHTHEQNTYLKLTLTNSSLVLTLSDEPLLALNQTEATQRWLTTELDANQDSISLTLEGLSVETSLQHALNFTGLISLAGGPSGEDRYVGCLSSVSVDSQTVQFPNDLQGGYNIGCCMPPRRSPSNGLGLFNHSLWDQILVHIRGVTVDEGGNVTLTNHNLNLVIPNNLIGYDVGYWLKTDLDSRTVFEVLSPPTSGYFTRGMSQITLDRFHYRDLVSNDPLSEIVFHHNGMKGTADSAILRAHFECKDASEGPWSQELTLTFMIIERNNHPYVLNQSPLSVAMGTRVVLTPSIITVADRETTNSSNILYREEYVAAMNVCGHLSNCIDNPAGQMEYTDVPGSRIKFFTQDDINNQRVAFQHSTRYGNEQVTIGLRVQDGNEGGNTVHVKLIVNPFTGSISFTPLEISCSFLAVGHQTVLTPIYLNVTTNFQNQSPTIAYDILSSPINGRLEVFEPSRDKWSLVNETRASRKSKPPVIGHFTQSDVDSGYVRYTHDGGNLELLDLVHFKLRSSEFTEPSELDFCFHMIIEEELIQPDFVIQVSDLTVSEGGSALVDPSILGISLSEQQVLYDPHMIGVDIRITELKPIIVLETPPSVGRIEVRGQPITVGANFSLANLQGGEVYYHHGDDEFHNDTFGVSVRATVEVSLIKQPLPSGVVTVPILVSPVNDNSPVYTSQGSIVVTEGSFVKITKANILVEDLDMPGDKITIFLRRKPKTPEEIRTGIFAFLETPNIPINNFLMEDVLNERVIFSHTLNESAALNFKQVLRISDGEHVVSPKPQIKVIAVPHTLTVLLSSVSCLHSLDLVQSFTLTLDYQHFTFVMTDRHGNNSNLIPEVGVSLGKFPLYGDLYKTVDGNKAPVSQFTVSDLQIGRIQYQFTSDEAGHAQSDQFELVFRFGHSLPVLIPVPICISPIPIIDVVHIQSPTVLQEGLFILNSTYLWANNTRGEDGDTIRYEIFNPPVWGEIINLSGTPLSVFTQADLNQGRVLYNRFTSASDQRDNFTFQICSVEGNCTEEKMLEIDVDFIEITIVNTGIWVTEGERVSFPPQNLSGTVPDDFRQVRFFLHKNLTTSHGQILVDYGEQEGGLQEPRLFSMDDIKQGTVYYVNDGNEELNDSFVVNAQSSSPTRSLRVEILIKIFIIPVNDHIPQMIIEPGPNNHLKVAVGGTIQLHSRILTATDLDSDDDDQDLIYTTQGLTPFNGYMYLDTDPGSRSQGISQWTQRDINEGRLFYKNSDEEENGDVVLFRVDENLQLLDISGARNAFYFNIDLSQIIFKSNASLDFHINEGANKTISSEHLSYLAANDVTLQDNEILYQIVSVPENGELLLESIPVMPKKTMFTQRNIVEGKLEYRHDHSNTDMDKFSFNLGDTSGRTSSEVFRFNIDVQIIDDDPPTVNIVNPVLVVEQSYVTLNSDIIQITDRDTVRMPRDRTRDDVVCTVTREPLYGVLQGARFGAEFETTDRFTMFNIAEQNFRYINTLLGHTSDSFNFSITDGINPNPQNHTVEILILPETVRLSVGSVTVDEDSYASLEPEHFVIEHDYLSTVPGIIIVLEGPYKGHLSNNESEVRNFTTSELEQGLIRYEHGGAEDSLDNFTFVYHSNDPQGLNRESERLIFEVIVAPNNDQVPVLDPNRLLILTLWDNEVRVLDKRYFNTTDKDTSAYFLQYQVLFPGEYDWFVAYRNDTKTPIYTFTQQEVNEGRVVFVHRTDQDSVLRYSVTDGEFNTTGNLTIQADPLGLNCNVPTNPWLPITVDQNSDVVLTVDNLCCTTNDHENERMIMYHIESVQYGKFYDGDKDTMVFTKLDLKSGVVRYRHTDLDRWESVDTVQMAIETEFDTKIKRAVNITINLPVADPVADGAPAINNVLNVTEGMFACLNESYMYLDARNVQYDYWVSLPETERPGLSELDVFFNLTAMPQSGDLVFFEDGEEGEEIMTGFLQSDLVNGTVCYKHDNSETLTDSFQFTLSVEGPSIREVYSIPSTFTISILPVNDIRPGLNTTNPSVELVAGFKHILSREELFIKDGDSSEENVRIILHSLPDNAKLALRGEPLNARGNFSQADIDNGAVSLMPLQMSTDVFSFSFQDEDYNSTTIHRFSVSVVPHTLTVQGTKVVKYRQNENVVDISTESLSSFSNAGQNLTTFTITRQPEDGFLTVSNPPAQKGLSRAEEFTQADINHGRLRYVANSGSRQHRDSFTLNVKNSNLTIESVEVSIHVLVWGRIKDNIRISFEEDSDEYSYQLPIDTLSLGQAGVHEHPEIILLESPKYGYLDLKFINKRSIEKRQTEQPFTFYYDDLKNGWVYYIWDYDNPVNASQVQDSFMLLVNSSNSRPGQAYIELTVSPPSIPTLPPTTATTQTTNSPSPTQPENTASPSEENPAVIMVAIFAVLVFFLLTVIIVLFCFTQQKRIRRKLHLITSTPPPNPTLPGSPSSPTRHMAPQFNFDLHVDRDNHSLSSGFSEDGELPPLRSPLRSPTHSHAFSYSPPHPVHTIPSPTYTADRPLSRRPRVLSNVSITLSGRHSVLSEASSEEPSHLYSHSLPRPPPLSIAVPIPVRPASQVAVRANSGESGYSSYTHTVANSSLSVEETESTGGEFPSALDDGHVTNLPDHVTELTVVSGKSTNEEMDEGEGIHKLLDLNDPNVQRLFRSTHPVLKKQEYWF